MKYRKQKLLHACRSSMFCTFSSPDDDKNGVLSSRDTSGRKEIVLEVAFCRVSSKRAKIFLSRVGGLIVSYHSTMRCLAKLCASSVERRTTCLLTWSTFEVKCRAVRRRDLLAYYSLICGSIAPSSSESKAASPENL